MKQTHYLKHLFVILGVGRLTSHPRGDGLAVKLFEGGGEGAVAPEPAREGQLLGCKRAMCFHILAVEPFEMSDAQSVDVGVVCNALLGEVLAEIGTVGTYGLAEL